jgi:hypothetical protein
LKHEVKCIIQVQTKEHYRRDLGDSGEQKPKETLIPENASQTKLAYFDPQAEQANEHDEK